MATAKRESGSRRRTVSRRTARPHLCTVRTGGAVWALTEAEAPSPAAVAAIRFAALTGLRIGEVLAMRWEHVAFETGRLTMPETKTGRRTHDLPTPVLECWRACHG